jgi:hypothetical protein
MTNEIEHSGVVALGDGEIRVMKETLYMIRELVQEAKGAEGDQSYVIAHLDDAEGWIGKVEDALTAALSTARPAQEPAVMALDWVDRGEIITDRFKAPSIVGDYYVSLDRSGLFSWRTAVLHGRIVVGAAEEAKAAAQADYTRRILSALAAPQPSHTTNCCKCGRIIDTREKKDGGDDFGAQLNDGRWTCSIECDDAVINPTHSQVAGTPGLLTDPSPADHKEVSPSFWIWRTPGGDWQVSETEPSASGAPDVDCYQTGATPVRRIEVLELALKPFADIAPCVEYTDKRDGDIVHRQDVVEDGRRVGWKELTKDDFRRAAAAISPSPAENVLAPVDAKERKE